MSQTHKTKYYAGELFHATHRNNLAAISRDGLLAGSYLTSDSSVAAYYAETIEDEDEAAEAVTLRIPPGTIRMSDLEPDHPGLEEPLTTIVKTPKSDDLSKEDAIWAAWEGTQQTAQDCLELIGSCRCKVAIPAEVLNYEADLDDWHTLASHP